MRSSGVGAKALAIDGCADIEAIIGLEPSPPMVTAASETGAGAFRTALHAAGSAETRITSRARTGVLSEGRHGSSVNHQASDLSQPSPDGVASCVLQPDDPAGQPIRT